MNEVQDPQKLKGQTKITSAYSSGSDWPIKENKVDEIQLLDIFEKIFKGRKTIICSLLLFSLCASIYVFTVPDRFQAQMTLAPINNESDGMRGSLLGQLGGLANIAGVSLTSGSDRNTRALATLKSRKFIINFIRKYELEIPLAARKFNLFNRKFSIDKDIYDQTEEKWKTAGDFGGRGEPSDLELYNIFSSLMSINVEPKSNLVTLEIEWYDAEESALWANNIVKELNELLRQKERIQAERAIEYLEGALNSTKLINMQQVIFQLIESQLKTIMLADSKDEYAFNVIDPAVVPDLKVGPKRIKIIILGGIIGVMFGVLYVVITQFFEVDFKNKKINSEK